MATKEYMEGQHYSATVGGTVYEVAVAIAGTIDFSTAKTFGDDVTVQGDLTAPNIKGDTLVTGALGCTGDMSVYGQIDVTGHQIDLAGYKSIVAGEGSPEGVESAPVGCIYHRVNGGVGTAAYVKSTGTGNTGWLPISAWKVLTAAADDATPTVLGASHLLIPANGAPKAITQLDDSVAGQQVVIVLTSSSDPSTIADSATFMLGGGVSWGGSIDDTITLFTVNGGVSAVWREICRSAN
jgi:hypothetical protein